MTSFFPISDRNLILTGYIGPDMSGLGRQVAAQLNRTYVNVDALIAERLDLSVDDIRDYFGETRLKAVETEIIAETALRRDHVIRVSGRTLAQEEHLLRLGATGPVICVVVSLDLILHRLHVAMGARYHDPDERGKALSDLKREWAVRGKPDVHELNLTRTDNDTAIDAIISLWQELAIQRA
jgi:shikimate kinase